MLISHETYFIQVLFIIPSFWGTAINTKKTKNGSTAQSNYIAMPASSWDLFFEDSHAWLNFYLNCDHLVTWVAEWLWMAIQVQAPSLPKLKVFNLPVKYQYSSTTPSPTLIPTVVWGSRACASSCRRWWCAAGSEKHLYLGLCVYKNKRCPWLSILLIEELSKCLTL